MVTPPLTANKSPPVAGRPFTFLTLVLGAVVLLAAALKSQDFGSHPLLIAGFAVPDWLFVIVLQCEILLGCFLLGGFFPRQTRFAAVAFFLAGVGVNLFHAATGETSCACLGHAVPVRPAVMALFDAGAAIALWLLHPAPGACAWLPAPVALVIGLVVLTAGAAAISTADNAPLLEPVPATVELGKIPRKTQAHVRVRINNPNAFPVQVARWDASCPCLTVSLPAPLLDANGVAHCKVNLDLSVRPDFVGRLVAEVRGSTAAGRTAIVFKVAATVTEGEP